MSLKICVVSRSWLSHERSGVTNAVAQHVNVLIQAGHKISIIGSNQSVLHEKLLVDKSFCVRSLGSGALYSPARVDRLSLVRALKDSQADLIIIEGWQTALTTFSIEEAYELKIPILMISHGSSVTPFNDKFIELFRALGWKYYKNFVLPRLISKIHALTTLDLTASSTRFYDRDLAIRLGKPVQLLVNCPANMNSLYVERLYRKPQILVIGYYSRIKNQLDAVDLAATIPQGFNFKFVGPKHGSYYKKCVHRVATLGIKEKVFFLDDSECNLAEEISNSLLVLSTSITEALPITLIESMAAGTPFVATDVGAVSSLKGGLIAYGILDMRKHLLRLLIDHEIWNKLSLQGREKYYESYTESIVGDQLFKAIDLCINKNN